MKALKLYTGSLILICLSLIAGCSDQLISPGSSDSKQLESSELKRDFETASFKAKYTLNPGDSIILNYDNTNLILIKSYSVSNCTMGRKKDLLIRTSNLIGNSSLPCDWEDHGSFAFEDLSIKNISGQVKTIEVKLIGYTFNN